MSNAESSSLFPKSTQKLDDSLLTKKSEELRSDSNIKWFIFIVIDLAYLSNYHISLNTSGLQETLMTEFNMSNTQFSLLSTLFYLFAIFGAFTAPTITNQWNVYISFNIGQLFLFLNSVLLVLLLYTTETHYINDQVSLYIVYTLRSLMGIGFGLSSSVVSSIIKIWFTQSKWSPVALSLLSFTIEIGFITARYLIYLVYSLNNSLYQAYLLSAILSLISLFASFGTIIIEKEFLKIFYQRLTIEFENVAIDNKAVVNSNKVLLKFNRDYSKIVEFPYRLWLIILFISLTIGNTETFQSQMLDAFVLKYNISESYGDFAMSIMYCFTLIIIPLFTYYSKYVYKYLKVLIIIGPLLKLISCIIFLLSPIGTNYALLFSCTFIYSIGIEIVFAGCFPLLYIYSPLQLTSIVTSINTICFLFSGVIFTFLFGFIADNVNLNKDCYDSPVLMLAILSIITIIIAIIVNIIGK